MHNLRAKIEALDAELKRSFAVVLLPPDEGYYMKMVVSYFSLRDFAPAVIVKAWKDLLPPSAMLFHLDNNTLRMAAKSEEELGELFAIFLIKDRSM